MKNRRTVIVAFMLVAAMVMGIGYAAISGQLTISGEARFSGTVDEDLVVQFTGTPTVSDENHVTATASGQSGTMNVTFDAAELTGDADKILEATATYTIIYVADAPVIPEVTLTTDPAASTTSERWTISYEWGTNGNILSENGDTTTITLKVAYDASALTDYATSEDYTIDFKINYTSVE